MLCGGKVEEVGVSCPHWFSTGRNDAYREVNVFVCSVCMLLARCIHVVCMLMQCVSVL